MLHKRLNRQSLRILTVAHRRLDQRQVIEHAGGVVRVGVGLRLFEGPQEVALCVGWPPEPMAARTEHVETTKFGITIDRTRCGKRA